MPISAGSYLKPSRHSRHIDRTAGGSGPTAPAPVPAGSGEDIEGHLFLAFLGCTRGEPFRLE